MPIVTLTTDFGNKDYFVASVKGAILSQIKEVVIIDISNEIQPYNHSEAAYILKNTYKNFPEGTIHIIGVESELTPENRHIAMCFEEVTNVRIFFTLPRVFFYTRIFQRKTRVALGLFFI